MLHSGYTKSYNRLPRVILKAIYTEPYQKLKQATHTVTTGYTGLYKLQQAMHAGLCTKGYNRGCAGVATSYTQRIN